MLWVKYGWSKVLFPIQDTSLMFSPFSQTDFPALPVFSWHFVCLTGFRISRLFLFRSALIDDLFATIDTLAGCLYFRNKILHNASVTHMMKNTQTKNSSNNNKNTHHQWNIDKQQSQQSTENSRPKTAAGTSDLSVLALAGNRTPQRPEWKSA